MAEPRRIYAWVAKDRNGEEGILIYPFDDGPLPLVAVELRVARKLENAAFLAAVARGHTARLVEYQEVAVVQELSVDG